MSCLDQSPNDVQRMITKVDNFQFPCRYEMGVISESTTRADNLAIGNKNTTPSTQNKLSRGRVIGPGSQKLTIQCPHWGTW